MPEPRIELQDTSVLSPKYHVFYCDLCAQKNDGDDRGTVTVRRSPFTVHRSAFGGAVRQSARTESQKTWNMDVPLLAIDRVRQRTLEGWK
jgi:hypothetical protein